jgi:uncharacterized protein
MCGRRINLLRAIFFCVFLLPASAAPGASPPEEELIRVKVYLLTADPASLQPVVFLSDLKEERALPVWIGPNEATALDGEMRGFKNPRPFTHDLLEDVIRQTKSSLRRLIVTHSRQGTYYATLIFERNGAVLELDARPSDGMILALKFKAPVFVSRKLFAEMSVALRDGARAPKKMEEAYGVGLQELTPLLAQSFAYQAAHGFVITDVRQGSRAEKDGLQRGDIISDAEGKPVHDIPSFREILTNDKALLKVRVFRRSEYLPLTLHTK